MRFDLFAPFCPKPAAPPALLVGSRAVPLLLVRNPRARRYVLRLTRDGRARVTVPRGGSLREGQAFAQRNLLWLQRQLEKQAVVPTRETAWTEGVQVLIDGQFHTIQRDESVPNCFRLGPLCFRAETGADFRPIIERLLWRTARCTLPPRLLELAALHRLPVLRVTVRNQRSRWGSCSRRGVISLNWRLVQTPALVRDYIILHELAHLRHMNHSRRFWAEVARLCPQYEAAEAWIKRYGRDLQNLGSRNP
jgi:predicted metal-dependent hydrolase